MVEEKKVKPQGEIPHEGGKEIKTPLPKVENFVGPASSSSGQAKRADPIKPEEPKEKEPAGAEIAEKPAEVAEEKKKEEIKEIPKEKEPAGAEIAEKPAEVAEEKKPKEEKAKPEEVKAPEAPPKEKRKKIRNMNQEEIEKKLRETEERMGGLESKYAQHLLQRKEELLRKQEGQPKEK